MSEKVIIYYSAVLDTLVVFLLVPQSTGNYWSTIPSQIFNDLSNTQSVTLSSSDDEGSKIRRKKMHFIF